MDGAEQAVSVLNWTDGDSTRDGHLNRLRPECCGLSWIEVSWTGLKLSELN
jgi:hypothetical protein